MTDKKQYIRKFVKLLEIERKAEKERALDEIRTLSAKDREASGRAVSDLKGQSAGRWLDLHLVRFGRERPIRTEISNGDVILVSRGEPLKSDLQATVVKVGKYFIEAAFSQRVPRWVKQRGIRIDLFVNDVVYKRMIKNLNDMQNLPHRHQKLITALLSGEAGCPVQNLFVPYNGGLNRTQTKAISLALGADPIFCIHGPPGTGKTTTLVEVIMQYCRRGKKVLAAADSNVAVDNLLERLVASEDLEVVRIGHPARIGKGLERYSLFAKLQMHATQNKIASLRRKIELLVHKRDTFTKPTPAKLRGMSKERICTLSKKGKSMRGIDVETIRSMGAWIETDTKINTYFDRIRRIEAKAISEILEHADVVCATNASVGSEVMEGRVFDIAVIDEASQQIEPSTLLPLFRAPVAILAGDHKQLPPTVASDTPVLKRSLFERLISNRRFPLQMLRMQYRMHETIMDFPNKFIYDDKLIAHPDTANHRLAFESKDPLADGKKRVIFYNITGVEIKALQGHSYRNEIEAKAIVKFIKVFQANRIPADAIGVISPYLAQVKTIKSLLEKEGIDGIEVKTVDGFQGREKEIILVSFVRSNCLKAIGFVADVRRLNVTMTRARSKLVMVGDRKTLEANAPFDSLFAWMHGRSKKGDVQIIRCNDVNLC